MSLSDHEARAMAIKMLSKAQINTVHKMESARGHHLLPHEIARVAGTDTIKSHWGIPADERYMGAHAERIKLDVSSLIQDKKCHVDLSDPESRINFDFHIFHSGIDFAYNGARRVSSALEDDPFSRSTEAA